MRHDHTIYDDASRPVARARALHVHRSRHPPPPWWLRVPAGVLGAGRLELPACRAARRVWSRLALSLCTVQCTRQDCRRHVMGGRARQRSRYSRGASSLGKHGAVPLTRKPADCPLEWSSKWMRGIGFLAHVLPSGSVPTFTNAPVIRSRVPLFHMSSCASRTKSRGVLRKHSSVSGDEAGHSLREAREIKWWWDGAIGDWRLAIGVVKPLRQQRRSRVSPIASDAASVPILVAASVVVPNRPHDLGGLPRGPERA